MPNGKGTPNGVRRIGMEIWMVTTDLGTLLAFLYGVYSFK
jgi:hypothetical protein